VWLAALKNSRIFFQSNHSHIKNLEIKIHFANFPPNKLKKETAKFPCCFSFKL